MNAIILSVGDELVLGQTVDTNSAWISQQLAAIGCDIIGHRTVGDDQDLIELAIEEAAAMADVILLSGGLGPTEDDLTRQAIAALCDAELKVDDAWLAEMEGFFRKLGRRMPESNRIQAAIPAGATMLWNTCGTAAGILAMIPSIDVGQENGQERLVSTSVPLFAMPGVPKEMKAMFTRDVLPWIRERTGGAVILSRTLHTFGLGESAIAEKLGPLMARGRNPSVGTTVSGGVVSLRVNARFGSLAEAIAELDRTVDACRAALGDLVYGQDGQRLQDVLIPALRNSGTVATAESCTGGLIAGMLTDVSGSSAVFQQGWVTYSNSAKTDLLGVPVELIAEHGAVSEPVVAAMATGARARAHSTYGIAVSGIAGPTGGSDAKPVGTVCIGLASGASCDHGGHLPASEVLTRTFRLTGDREMIRDRAAKMALTMLRFKLLGKELPF